MTYELGVDVGGTFTDVVLFDQQHGRPTQIKVPSTPDDPSAGVIDGIETVLDRESVPAADVARVFHGTTIATNTVLEHSGATTGLITTEGFRDVLQIGRQTRPHLYDFRARRPEPLVRRRHRLTVPEAVGPDGTVRDPLDRGATEEAVDALATAGVDAIAVCLLHAYANPDHERLVADAAADLAPDLRVVRSSEILPEYREYERMSTTVLNAYVQSDVASYVERLESGIAGLGIDAPFGIMQSNGGVMTAETAAEKSVHTLLSGPAAGVLAGRFVGTLTGTEDLITFDMGGTSSDICAVRGGDPEYSVENEVGGYPVRVPMIDINTIGAGGGSIAWIDDGGALRVGPRSAGADPGPVCYGRGGTEPTVTDAHLVLGRLNPGSLLGGELEIADDRARAAVRESLAEPLGLSLREAAAGVLDVVTANMVRGIRVVSVERGYDPREFGLVAFGGAGPLHAHRLVRELDMAEAIIPVTPGVASSSGLLFADTKHDFVRSVLADVEDLGRADLRTEYAELEAEARDRLATEDVDDWTFRRSADMKYRRQGYELAVPVADAVLDEGVDALRDVFEREHEREHGFSLDDPAEVVNVRLSAVASRETPRLRSDERDDGSVDAARTGTRDAVFAGETWPTGIYDRTGLRRGDRIDGPAIVEELSSTVVVAPDQAASVDEHGTVHIAEDDR